MTTEKLPNLYQRMIAIMTEVDYILKGDKTVNNQYRFVSHDAVTAKVRKHFITHGVLCVPSVIERVQNGNRTELAMEIQFINVDEPSEVISIRTVGDGIDPQDKGCGKAISYCFKYGLLKALMLETGEDSDRDQIPHIPDLTEEFLAKLEDGFDRQTTHDALDAAMHKLKDDLRQHPQVEALYKARGKAITAADKAREEATKAAEAA